MQGRTPQVHVKKAISVLEYGYYEDKNFPTRQGMEDNHIAIDNFANDGSGLFGILDGHGGSDVSQYCANCLPNVFQQEYEKNKNNIKQAFQNTMKKMDQQLKMVGANETGSTCCITLVQKIGNKRVCHVANLGDSRAVISVQGTAKRVSTDHKVSLQSQQQRVKKEGGLIIKGRVGGQLAITRALGDLQLKSEGLSNVPDIEEVEITKQVNFMIIASDGLWDVCEDQKAVQLVQKIESSADMAKTLVQHAMKSGSKDNISAIVLKFN